MDPLAELLGESPPISAVRTQVRRLLERQTAARRLPPVLILGETGTGKGLLASAIHRAGARARGPFVSINCAALPETLLESELFGFEPGAFTGASRAKAGLFQTADRGTLFLDEVGALSLGLQAKLLTTIEERTVRRLGSTRSELVDVWVIAATNEDLPAAAQDRRFRQDLYHRLSAIVITLPPLRERGSDVLVLAEHFLAAVCRDYGLPPKRLAPDAQAALVAYPWPGNVRELANVTERVAVLGDDPLVSARELGLPPVTAELAARDPGRSLKDSLGEIERSQLLAAMEASEGNLSRAAALLGIPRNTLRYRLGKHHLWPEATPRTAPPLARPAPPRPAEGPERPIIFLWVGLDLSPERLSQTDEPLGIARDKVRAFGGRLEEIDPAGVVASFGLEPVDDPAANAVHVALAIKRALERDAEGAAPPRFRALIHLASCPVQPGLEGDPLDPVARERALASLRELAGTVEADAILVSPAAIPALRYRFALVPTGAAGLVRVVTRAPGIAGRPSVAVLPFRNLTGDAAQDYFGDGITEDIIGALSRFRWLFVIAHSSTLVYKSRSADVGQIASELGVRYLLTGTVRRAAAHLRVTADLNDAELGNTIWAEHFDGDLSDIFKFQDHITARIASTLDAKVRQAEIQRVMAKRSESLDAYDCVLRALSLIYRLSRSDFFAAGELLEQATGLDPSFAAAYAWRAFWYLLKIGQGWSATRDGDTAAAAQAAEKALELDPDDPMALAISGHLSAILQRDYDRAVRRFERSLALNPNSAFAWGISVPTFYFIGEPAVGLERATYAMRLSPFDPMTFYFLGVAATAAMLAGRYDEAVTWAQKSRHENPRFSLTLRTLGASLAHLNRLDEARDAAREFLAIETGFTLSNFRKEYPIRDRATLEWLADNLRKAGLPE